MQSTLRDSLVALFVVDPFSWAGHPRCLLVTLTTRAVVRGAVREQNRRKENAMIYTQENDRAAHQIDLRSI
eukprot:scaffold218701_cov14-Prasinocladus_malaysianus.AAC.1